MGGVDYEIDCALADALELVEQHLVDPLCDAAIKPQARLGTGERMTAWDCGIEMRTAVEAKRKATAVDVAEWLERAAAAGPPSGGTFRLVFGEAAGSWETTLSRYLELAKEADDDERLRELAAADRLACPVWLRPLSVAFLRQLELRRHEPAELARLLATRTRALFVGKPELVLPVMREHLRIAARARKTVRASDLLAAVRAVDVVPRELQAPVPLDEGDARRVTLFLVSRCVNGLPAQLLRAILGDRSTELGEALASLSASGFVTVDEESAVVRRRGPPPHMAPRNGPAILDRALQCLLATIDTGPSWARQAHVLRLAAELCMAEDISPRTAATAFRVLDKHLKNLGDVRLVLRTSEACAAAARKPPATEEARKGEVHALICGLSWAKQRMGLLEEARGHAVRSKEMGAHLPWPRNTAFCCKCIGRLLRMEAMTKPAGPERKELLDESVSELREAIKHFTQLAEATAAERNAELGACYSLLGRSFLELEDRQASLEAIAHAQDLIPEGRKKDAADLWILRGEFELGWGTQEYARTAFAQAIEATNDPAFEVAEMRARAFEQRSKAAESTDAALADLEQARVVFTRLGDTDAAARTEFACMLLQGRVPKELQKALAVESCAVSVRAVARAEQERSRRGSAVAYRDAIPGKVVSDWIAEARREAVIEDGGASHVAAPRAAPPARELPKRRKQALATVWKRVVPSARNAEEAARTLAGELVGSAPQLPVQVEAIARRVGVEDVRAAELGRNGELRIEGEVARIFYSNSLGRQRHRFTVAHELGHFLLISRGNALVNDGRALEHFCDTFAGALLMPESLLPKLPQVVSVDNLLSAAKRFDVSLPAVAIRLHQARGRFQAFCVDGDQVEWSAGELRRGRVSTLPDTLRELVAAALEGTADVPHEVFLETVAYGGRWSVSLRQSDARRLVVVLSPCGPVARPRHYG